MDQRAGYRTAHGATDSDVAGPGRPRGHYTLYAVGDNGRVWLATHEWTKGSLKISGEEFAIPKDIWNFLPRDVPLWLKLRRVPAHASDQPRDLATSDRLRLIRK